VKKKSLPAIEVEQVEQLFDDAFIQNLAMIAKLPADADKERFGKSIREAARIYARDVREPNANELHTQIGEIHQAATRLEYERVATLVENLSAKALDMLKNVAATDLPPTGALRDHAQRKNACETIARLCRIGGERIEGRMRPSGKRSKTWQWTIYGPEPSRTPLKRQAERDFVMYLQLAWAESVGRKPPQAANINRLGPFALMVQACLRRAGAVGSKATVVGYINELNRYRRLDHHRPLVRR
jgi:hypothetical protein